TCGRDHGGHGVITLGGFWAHPQMDMLLGRLELSYPVIWHSTYSQLFCMSCRRPLVGVSRQASGAMDGPRR
ncbi:hypothetical protein NPS74_06560, partial [Cutibacterium acnes subsp. acnes]|nr:hypothetical protein [Cutibacterium acnes subsp. acnes]